MFVYYHRDKMHVFLEIYVSGFNELKYNEWLN